MPSAIVFSISRLLRDRAVLFLVTFAVLMCGFVLAARPASAGTCVFQSAGNNNFVDPGNWTCGRTPTLGDNVWIPAGTSTSLSATSTILVQNVYASGTLDVASGLIQVTSTVTVIAGGSVSSTTGVMQLNAVTSTGSFGTTAGSISVTTTVQNNGWFALGSGTATTTSDFTNAISGTVNLNTGTLILETDFTQSGTFNANTGTFRLHGGNDQSIAAVTLYNFIIQKSGGEVSISPNITVGNDFTLVSGLLVIDTTTFTVSGTYTNRGGLVTVASGGSIVAANGGIDFTNSDETVTSTIALTFGATGDLYVVLQDNNRNFSATNTDTLVVTVSGTSASGGDSETITLSEDIVNSGIFGNLTSALPITYGVNATHNDGTFTVNDGDTLTVRYTDAYDSTDTGSDTVAVTVAAATVSPSSGSGGLGASGGGSGSGLPPVTTQYQEVAVGGTVIPLHTLVKLTCPAGAAVNDPCKAVYYVGSDAKRHAFPNDKVYFTWYSDFSGVQLVSDAQMAGIPLGKNVTYKPGVKMVKFTTDPKVYVVGQGGTLRWVTTEAVAVALYGAAWNTMIDDISDAFYANYRFGVDVFSEADFNPAAARASVVYPSDSLGM